MKIELRHLTKAYGRLKALDDFSLTISPGTIVSVIGLNGAGKTTLLNCLAGLVAPTRGSILYDDIRFDRSKMDLRRELFFLPDFPPLYGDFNPLQHISLMLRIFERDPTAVDDRILTVLGDLDLLPLAETPIAGFSRGQLYKTAFAAMLSVQPKLWLLDEPFASGLDPHGLSMVKQYSRAAAAYGATIVYSTQILEIAEKFADLIVVVDHGQLRAKYTRAELDMLPPSGPDSLESKLRQFREIAS